MEGQVLDKDGNLISDRISNSGSIQADGGQVILSAKNASNIIKNVINMDGVIEAKTVTEKNGRIFLGGGDQGTVRVAGTLNASGEEPGEQGGEITIEGADVIVARGSIQAKGTDAKGGNITITGTDWVNAGGTMDVSGKTGGNVNITTGGLSFAAPVLAKGTTGQGGNININTLFKSWEVVSAMLDVPGQAAARLNILPISRSQPPASTSPSVPTAREEALTLRQTHSTSCPTRLTPPARWAAARSAWAASTRAARTSLTDEIQNAKGPVHDRCRKYHRQDHGYRR